MSRTFRAWDADQACLLPASAHEFVPRGSAVTRFVANGLIGQTIATGKLNGGASQAWFTEVLRSTYDRSVSTLDVLLPWTWKMFGASHIPGA